MNPQSNPTLVTPPPASATPQIILGDPAIGYTGDNLRVAHGKYNVHRHELAASGNFLTAGAKPGLLVNALTFAADEVFPQGTVVESVSSTSLICSNVASLTDVYVDLYLKQGLAPTFIKIANCSVVKNSNIITCTPQDGFVTAKQVLALATGSFTGVLPLCQSGFYPVGFGHGFAGTVVAFSVLCLEPGGSASCTLYVAGSPKASLNANNSVSTHDFLQTQQASTSFTAQEQIALSVSGSGASISYSIRYVKSLEVS